MRWCAVMSGLALTAGIAGGISTSAASAATSSSFHCPGVSGSQSESFVYYDRDGTRGPNGEPSPSKALAEFIRTKGRSLHVPLAKWSHHSKNLFEYSGVHGNIQVTTFRFSNGSYLVTRMEQSCLNG
jgi:hypothetical protein